MDAVVKPTWRYLRRPLTGTAQTHRTDSGRRVTSAGELGEIDGAKILREATEIGYPFDLP
jgi:hypothetical protein